ncbi:MAG: S1C family serine protease [Breznakia sp.]
MKSKILKTTIGILCICTLILTGAFGGYMISIEFGNQQNSTSTKTDNESAIALLSSKDVSTVAEKASETVVEIKTESVQRGRYMQDYVSEGAGSGVIISETGYIITNYHVIDGARRAEVTLKNGNEYDAEYIGGDEESDLAILKIDTDDTLTVATFADSEDLLVGQGVLAIGNPLGELGGSVTQGILSSTSREISIENVTMTLLQTDAAINPGNSGGGLFDEEGNLIGIVNAKSSGSDIEGLGFAIPSNIARAFAEDVIDE